MTARQMEGVFLENVALLKQFVTRSPPGGRPSHTQHIQNVSYVTAHVGS